MGGGNDFIACCESWVRPGCQVAGSLLLQAGSPVPHRNTSVLPVLPPSTSRTKDYSSQFKFIPLPSRRFWSFNWFANFQEHLSSLENIWPRRNIHVSFELVKELIEKYYIELERKSKYVLWQIFTFRAEVEARVRGKFQLSKMEYNKYSNMDRIAKENCFCKYENRLTKWRL